MPNPLKKKISNLSNRNFWFSGKIKSHENEYCIITELYDAKKGKLIEQREFIGDDMFKLIDNLSLQLRYDLGIPASHIESTEFLPLSDIYTNSMKAFEYYVKGKVAKLGYDSTASEDYYNKALTADKDFAMVYYTLSDLHHDSESIEKLTESINSAMSRLYKFPESIQYQVKDSYFRYIEKNPDKLLKLNILWTKLNPNSIQAHLQLGYAYYMAGDLDNALKSALVVYNMDMSSFSNLIHIIEIHKRRKNYEEAIMLLTKFCNNYPDNHRSYLALGRLYEAMGDFHKAKDQFETASLLEPNNNFIKLRLCNLETKFGNFDSAINQLIILDKDPRKTSDEKYEIYRALSLIYKKLGQIKTSIKYVEQMYELGFL